MLVSAFSLRAHVMPYFIPVFPRNCHRWNRPRTSSPKVVARKLPLLPTAIEWLETSTILARRQRAAFVWPARCCRTARNNQAILNTAQQIFRAVGAELFSAPDMNEAEAMTALCLQLNRGLMEAASGVHPCPAFIGCYHEKFGTLCYTNAGHTPGVLRDRTGMTEVSADGFAAGSLLPRHLRRAHGGHGKRRGLLLVSRGVVEGKCKRR